MPGGSWRPIGGKAPPHWPTATEAADPATLFLTMRQLRWQLRRWSSWPASPTLAPTTLTSPSCCGIGKALTSAAGSGVGPVRGREVPDPGVGSYPSAIAHAPGTGGAAHPRLPAPRDGSSLCRLAHRNRQGDWSLPPTAPRRGVSQVPRYPERAIPLRRRCPPTWTFT